MKKTSSLMIAGLLCLSMFAVFKSDVRSQSVTYVLHVSILEQGEVQRIIDNAGSTDLFTVTQVGIEEFNSGNPSDLSAYHVIVFGINDWGEQYGDRSRSYQRLAELEAYVRDGGGIVWTHDTLLMGTNYGSLLNEPAGIDRPGLNIGYTYKKAQIMSDHPVLHSPFEIGVVSDVIDIQSQAPWPHTSGGRIVDATRIIRGYDITEIAPDSVEETDNFYLTTHEYHSGRVLVFGALGHLILREDRLPTDFWMPPLLECQLFVNALSWASGAVVNQPPVADFRYRGPKTSFTPSTIYVGSEVKFDAGPSDDPDGTIVSYTWNFGDGSDLLTTTENVTNHTYVSSGPYTVTLVVTDDKGATGEISRDIFIHPFEWALFVEIDYVTGHKPSSTALEYIEGYYGSNGINLVLYVDDEVGDPTPGDLMITHDDFWIIENSWNEAWRADDRAFGDENYAKTKLTLPEKWVLWGTVWGTNPNWYGATVHIVRDWPWGNWYAGNYIFIADTLVEWYARDYPDKATKTEVQTMLLMHELGHCIGIYQGEPDNEYYDPNINSVMHGVKRPVGKRIQHYRFNKKIDEKYSRIYWDFKDMDDYAI